jgi:hypothetical protein
MMRQVVKALLLAAIVLCASIPAQSQIRLYGGKYDKPDNWFAGAGYEFGLLPLINIIPNYEYVFTDNGHFYTLAVDGSINFLVVGFAGAGVGWNFVGGDGIETKNRAAFNIIGGASLNSIPLSPFLQLKYVFLSEESNTWSIGVGIHL